MVSQSSEHKFQETMLTLTFAIVNMDVFVYISLGAFINLLGIGPDTAVVYFSLSSDEMKDIILS